MWLIQLASQIHEILSNESPIAKTHSALLPLWTHPFTSSDGATHATSRADELALSLLSVWAEQTPKYAPWSDSDLSYWNSNDFTSKLDACLIRKLANIPHAGAKGASKDNVPTGDDNQQSIVNLTARLIAAILGMNSSLSCRVISKALTRLPSDILLPICFSGPISR